MPTPIKHNTEDSAGALEALARLLGRQLAREHFAAPTPAVAKDNPSPPSGTGEPIDDEA